MKKISLVILFFIYYAAQAQKMPPTEPRQVRIYESDKTVLAGIEPVKPPRRAKPGRYYYWYSANIIHATQGGFSGRLLDGPYTAFYLNKNLKEQGAYSKGLKAGVWKAWQEDGSPGPVTRWKKGVLVPGDSVSFWKKIKRFVHHKKA